MIAFILLALVIIIAFLLSVGYMGLVLLLVIIESLTGKSQIDSTEK